MGHRSPGLCRRPEEDVLYFLCVTVRLMYRGNSLKPHRWRSAIEINVSEVDVCVRVYMRVCRCLLIIGWVWSCTALRRIYLYLYGLRDEIEFTNPVYGRDEEDVAANVEGGDVQ